MTVRLDKLLVKEIKIRPRSGFIEYSRVSHIRNRFFKNLICCFRIITYCFFRNLVSQFPTKWFLTYETLLYQTGVPIDKSVWLALYIVGQMGVNNDNNTAFYDEELKSGTVLKESIKSKTDYRAKYHWSWLCDPTGILCFSPILWPQNKNRQFWGYSLYKIDREMKKNAKYRVKWAIVWSFVFYESWKRAFER